MILCVSAKISQRRGPKQSVAPKQDEERERGSRLGVGRRRRGGVGHKAFLINQSNMRGARIAIACGGGCCWYALYALSISYLECHGPRATTGACYLSKAHQSNGRLIFISGMSFLCLSFCIYNCLFIRAGWIVMSNRCLCLNRICIIIKNRCVSVLMFGFLFP